MGKQGGLQGFHWCTSRMGCVAAWLPQVLRATRGGVQDVAVKVLQSSEAGPRAEFRREISILRCCLDSNIVQFLGTSAVKGRPALVTELLAGGDLRAALTREMDVDVARRLYAWQNRRGARGMAWEPPNCVAPQRRTSPSFAPQHLAFGAACRRAALKAGEGVGVGAGLRGCCAQSEA
jgi:Protein tyrosine and serine/threonine kinase